MNRKALVRPQLPRTTPLRRPTLTCLQKAGKGIAFTLTLSVAGWSNLAQTLEDARFLDAEYAYIVTPTADSLTAWGDAGVKVGDITENGKMPFTCTDTPTSAISVNIFRAEVAQ